MSFLPGNGLLIFPEQALAFTELRIVHRPSTFFLFFCYGTVEHLMINNKPDEIKRHIFTVQYRVYPYVAGVPAITA